MKPCCSQAQQDHGTPRTPLQRLPGLGSRFPGEGRRLMELGPAAHAWLEHGCPWVLPASVCLFSCGSRCSVSFLGQLGPKLIPVLCLDGFPLLVWFFNISWPKKAKGLVLHSAIRFGYQSP